MNKLAWFVHNRGKASLIFELPKPQFVRIRGFEFSQISQYTRVRIA